MFLVASNLGVALSESYDVRPWISPVYNSIPQCSFLWEYLGDFWSLLDQREVIETCWRAIGAVIATEYHKLWQARLSPALVTLPLGETRRWIGFEIWRESLADFTAYQDTQTSYLDPQARYAITRLRPHEAFLAPLRNTIPLHTSLKITARIRARNISPYNLSHVCLGYAGADRKSFLGIIVLGNGTLGIIAGDKTQPPNIFLPGVNTQALTYSDADGAHVIDLGDGTVFHTLLANGLNYEVTFTQDGDTLMLQVRAGEDEILHLQTNVSQLHFPYVPDFSTFGFFTLEEAYLRTIRDDARLDGYSHEGVDIALAQLRFLDPTFAEEIELLPALTTRLDLTNLSDYYLQEGTAYTLREGLLDFLKLPSDEERNYYWAEYVVYRSYKLYQTFGVAVGAPRTPDSRDYLSQVMGLFAAGIRSATPANLALGVHAVVGLPLVRRAGVVRSINMAYSPTHGKIRVGDDEYYFPRRLSRSDETGLVLPGDETSVTVVVGDTLPRFQRLCWGVEVWHTQNRPDWIDPYIEAGELHILERYHTFEVAVYTAVSTETLDMVRRFLDMVRRRATKYMLVVGKLVEEDLSFTEAVTPALEDLKHWVYDGHTLEPGEVIELGNEPDGAPTSTYTTPSEIGGQPVTAIQIKYGCKIVNPEEPGEEYDFKYGQREPL